MYLTTTAMLSGRLASRHLSTRAPSTFLSDKTPVCYYSTVNKNRGVPSADYHIPAWVLYTLPALGVYGVLAFLKNDESSIRAHLKDENKVIGRAHDCEEVHEQDIDKWVSEHPGIKHRGYWQALKKDFKDHTGKSREQ